MQQLGRKNLLIQQLLYINRATIAQEKNLPVRDTFVLSRTEVLELVQKVQQLPLARPA